MRTRCRWLPLALGGVSLLGCADVIVPTGPTVLPPSSVRKDEIPPEYYWPAIIAEEGIKAFGFEDDMLKAAASAEYWGTHMSQTLKVDASTPSRSIPAVRDSKSDSHISPFGRALGTQVGFSVGSDCGYSATAAAYFYAAVKWQVGGEYTMSEKERSDQKQAVQPKCPEEPRVIETEGGGGTGGGECCRYYRVDWYWIYSDGTREYITSTYYSECGCG